MIFWCVSHFLHLQLRGVAFAPKFRLNSFQLVFPDTDQRGWNLFQSPFKAFIDGWVGFQKVADEKEIRPTNKRGTKSFAALKGQMKGKKVLEHRELFCIAPSEDHQMVTTIIVIFINTIILATIIIRTHSDLQKLLQLWRLEENLLKNNEKALVGLLLRHCIAQCAVCKVR